MWSMSVPVIFSVASGGVWSSTGMESCTSISCAVLQPAARTMPLAISTPTATPSDPLSPTNVGGRPVLRDWCSATTSTTVPEAMSSSMTLVTVDRERPISASAPRLSAPRSRNAPMTRARLARRWVDVGSGFDMRTSISASLRTSQYFVSNMGNHGFIKSGLDKTRCASCAHAGPRSHVFLAF